MASSLVASSSEKPAAESKATPNEEQIADFQEAANQRFGAIEFSHAFQPIVTSGSLKVESYEVLIRGPSGQPPFTVFDQIEKPDTAAFDQYSRQRAIGKAMQLGLSSRLNLNFFPGSLLHSNGLYLAATMDAAEKHGLPANKLVIELTETEFVQDIDKLIGIINEYRQSGLSFSIDDFGSGYAGLNLLADLQPEQLKLDRRLIEGIDCAGPRQSIVNAICNICLDLGITVLAEGVETEGEYLYLQDKGIDLFQGYFFARPGFEEFPTVQ